MRTNTNRQGQGTVEWVLILAFIALTAQVLTTKTGMEVEQLFRTSADAIGVEFRSEARSEVVAASSDDGGIAASGRTVRARLAARSSQAS